MSQAILVIRILGILLALFLVMSVLVAVSGELYSVKAPPLAQRMLSALPGALLSVLLLLPQRFFLRGVRYKALLLAFVLAATALAAIVGRDIVRTLSGDVHWAIIPTGVTFFFILLGNSFSLWAQHRKLPPNNSFKPNPLRGSA